MIRLQHNAQTKISSAKKFGAGHQFIKATITRNNDWRQRYVARFSICKVLVCAMEIPSRRVELLRSSQSHDTVYPALHAGLLSLNPSGSQWTLNDLLLQQYALKTKL